MSTPHNGVPSLPPEGNDMVNVSAPLDIVPVSVPLLFLWHDAHDPSAGSTALVATVPDTIEPICVSVHVIAKAPCESVPDPVHVPATADSDGCVGAVAL
jgi:hypothetical protein